MHSLKHIIIEDIIFFKRKMKCKSALRIILITKSFHLLLLYRFLNFYWHRRYFRFFRTIIRYFAEILTGCEIHPEATIGSRIFFPHPLGIVIGQNVTSGNDVVIFQHVTLGGRRNKNGSLSYPKLHNNVTVFCNCCILGNADIGSNSVIGACSLVLSSFPANSTIFGSPAKLKP